MATYFHTQSPQALLDGFDARIRQSESKGKITTWEKVDGGYYTHKASDWHGKAFLKPQVSAGLLTFNIIAPTGQAVSVVAYGYYHGHLIETFLNHFDTSFSSASASPNCVAGDICSAAA